MIAAIGLGFKLIVMFLVSLYHDGSLGALLLIAVDSPGFQLEAAA